MIKKSDGRSCRGHRERAGALRNSSGSFEGNEFIAHCLRSRKKFGFLAFLIAELISGESAVIELLACGPEVEDDASQVVSGRCDGFRRAKFRSHTPVEITERALAVLKRLRSETRPVRLVVTATVTFGFVSLSCKVLQQFKERFWLSDEQPHGRQELHCAHRNPFCLRRSNDRTYREVSAQEGAGLGHDKVRLEGLASKRSRIEVRKRQAVGGVGQRSQGVRNRIARLVRPGLKMHCFSRADAEEYSQDFHAARPLCHRRVKAIATLFDGRHVERGGVGDGLEVVIRG